MLQSSYKTCAQIGGLPHVVPGQESRFQKPPPMTFFGGKHGKFLPDGFLFGSPLNPPLF